MRLHQPPRPFHRSCQKHRFLPLRQFRRCCHRKWPSLQLLHARFSQQKGLFLPPVPRPLLHLLSVSAVRRSPPLLPEQTRSLSLLRQALPQEALSFSSSLYLPFIYFFYSRLWCVPFPRRIISQLYFLLPQGTIPALSLPSFPRFTFS